MSSDIQRSISASIDDGLRDYYRLGDFTGRAWVFDRLNTWLEADMLRTFVLTGEPGTGKSTLAARLVQFSQGELTATAYPHLGRHCLTSFHFCQVRADSTLDPRRFVETLSLHLADRYQPFALALTKMGGQEIIITASQTVGTAESGATITNVAIKELHIGKLSARRAFDQLVRRPLEQLCTRDFQETILILVDALDEAVSYDPDENLVALLSHITSDAADLPPQVRFLLTTRPDPRVLHLIGEPSLDLLADAPADVDDVRVYTFHRLHFLADPHRGELADRVAKEGKGNFLYARYVLDDLLPRLDQVEDLRTRPLPRDLKDVYRQFLRRELGQSLQKDWHELFGPILGTLAVARGEGLTRTQLAGVVGRTLSEVDDILLTCAQYLAGNQPEGPFRIYHQSFREFLLEDRSYRIYPDEANKAIVRFFFEKNKDNWLSCQESYALQYTPSHLLEAVQQAEQQQEGQLWPELEALLCDLRFVEAKCAAGLVYDLEADYDAALAVLPEAQQEQERTRAHRQEVARYTQDLIAYAKAWREARARQDADPTHYPLPAHEAIPLPIIATVHLWTDDELRADTERIIHASTRLDRLHAFATFVRAESHHLMQFATLPGFCVQQAYNSADAGPLVSAASSLLLAETGTPLLLLLPAQRDAYAPHPALLRTLADHTDQVNSVSVTPDGQTAVSGSSDHTVRVWDLTSGKCRHTLQGHTGGVWSVSVTPDGQTAVSGSDDNTMRVWDLTGGVCLRTLEGHTRIVNRVSVTPDGQTAVSGSTDGTVRVWDLVSGECRHTLQGGGNAGVSVMPDGQTAVSGSTDGTVQVWDLISGECRHTLGRSSDIFGVSVTPDGQTAVLGGGKWAGTVQVWDLISGECRHTLRPDSDSVTSVSVTPDGHIAVSGDGSPMFMLKNDDAVQVWDLTSGACLRTFATHTGPVISVSLTPDGQTAVSGSWDRTVRIWNLTNGEYHYTFQGHPREVSSVSLTPDDQTAVSVSGDGTVRVWDLTSGKCRHTLQGTNGTGRSVTPDGQTIYVSEYAPNNDRSLPISDVSVTPDGQTAVSESWDRTVRVWDLVSGECRHTLQGHPGMGRCHCITPNGQTLVIDSSDHTVQVWDLTSGKCRHTLQGEVSSVSLTPDDQTAVSVSGDGTVRVWDLTSGKCRHTLQGEVSSVSHCITPDGQTFVMGSSDGTVQVWDLVSGKCLHMLKGHTYEVWRVSVTPDGQTAVSVDDRTVRVWDLASGKCRHTLSHPDGVASVSITPDGRMLVSGGGFKHTVFMKSTDNTVRVWDLATGNCRHLLEGHTEAVLGISITPNGQTAVSGSWDRTVRVWDLASGRILAFFPAPSKVKSLSAISTGGQFCFGTENGQVVLVTLQNVPFAPPHITAVRLGSSDELTTRCMHCSQLFVPPQRVLNAIHDLTAHLAPGHSPCLELPPEAWDDPRLLVDCPHCHKPVQFNPFVLDQRKVKL
jgi:WD40 repeat protein